MSQLSAFKERKRPSKHPKKHLSQGNYGAKLKLAKESFTLWYFE